MVKDPTLNWINFSVFKLFFFQNFKIFSFFKIYFGNISLFCAITRQESVDITHSHVFLPNTKTYNQFPEKRGLERGYCKSCPKMRILRQILSTREQAISKGHTLNFDVILRKCNANFD